MIKQRQTSKPIRFKVQLIYEPSPDYQARLRKVMLLLLHHAAQVKEQENGKH